MTGRLMMFCLIGVLLFSCQDAGDETQTMPSQVPLNDANWTLSWSDEFNGTGDVDPAKWEQMEYERKPNPLGPDGFWDPDFVQLDGLGHLDIFVDEIPNDNVNSHVDSDATDYAVGMVRSRGLFSQTYGKFEVSCRLPSQPGWWVAFWLFPNLSTEPWDGSSTYGTGRDGTEIDIMEGWGWTNRVQSALHIDGYGDHHQSQSQVIDHLNLNDGEYHTYSLVWTPAMYVFYIDGIETWRVTDPKWISQVPAYVKITGELTTEEWALNDAWANALPADYGPDHFLVDWIRVYEYRVE